MTELDLILCTITNIQVQKQIIGSQFLALTDLLKVATLICDQEGNITFINQQGLKMLNATSIEFMNLKLADVLVQAGFDLVHRLKMHPSGLRARPLDDVLIDVQGVRQRVSMLVHPLELSASGAERTMIVVVPELQRTALHQAFARSGSIHDYLANLLLLTQEAERKRIAAELHDGLGQVLTALKFLVEHAVNQLNVKKTKEARGILEEVVVQLRGAVGEVRRISTELRPPMLDDLGLIPTLQWFCRQFEAAHVNIRVTFDNKLEENDIPIPLKTSIFRMIQEAMNNVAKHAQATSVFTYLKAHRDGFVVGVIDNGIGFDAEGLTLGAVCSLGVGINSMRERVEASSGVFHIRSHVGSGTAISAAWNASPDDFQWSGRGVLENENQLHKSRRPFDMDLT